tara:strand:+ start:933 stop:1187 length:255 start_codon:yes stop_codon:yes gene_type:complete
MEDENVLDMYQTINKSNERLRDKKNELEFILNRYHQVISKINLTDITDSEERILIQTVQEVFKKGKGNINDLIDIYVKTLMDNK